MARPASLSPAHPGVLASLIWLALLCALPTRPSTWLVAASGLPVLLLVSRLSARARHDRTWWTFVRETADWHVLAGFLLYWLGVQLADGHGITTDGAVYFSQLRSVIFDRDLDVAAEFAYLGQPPRPGHFVPIGPTILWLPLYLAVTAVDGLGRLAGWWALPESGPSGLGLTLPYVRAVTISSFAIGAAGLAAIHASVRARMPRAVTLATSVLLFGATPLLWYMVYEPAMTHAASFGVVALFVAACGRWVPYALTPRRRIGLGALAALAFLMRPQEALFVLVPAALILAAHPTWAERVTTGLSLLRGAAIGAAPLLILQAVHGVVLYQENTFRFTGEQGYLDPWHSRWADTLFSSWHGFFAWSPVAYLAVIGTALSWRRQRAGATVALLLVGLMAWVNGSTADWAGGWSFGGRRFLSTLPVLAPGLAVLIDGAVKRPWWLLSPAVAIALLWNHLLMVQYTAGMVPKDEPVSFGRLVRQQADLHTRSPYFYPFAFPANALFAWREGVPIDRYDLLAPEPLRPQVDITLDRQGQKFLLEGWDAPGGDDWGSHWWLGGSPAELAVPADLPTGRAIQVEVTLRARFESPAFASRLAVVVNGTTVGTVTALPETPAVRTLRVPGSPDGRPWRRGINRIALQTLDVSRIDPADTRPDGPIAAARGSRPWPVALYRLRLTPER